MTRLLATIVCLLLVLTAINPAQPQEPKFKGKGLDEWAKKARDPNPYVRIKVAYSLYTVIGEVGPKNATSLLPVLKELLKDDDEAVRRNAAFAFGRFGPAG